MILVLICHSQGHAPEGRGGKHHLEASRKVIRGHLSPAQELLRKREWTIDSTGGDMGHLA